MKLVLNLLLLLYCADAKAQLWDELFNQRQTQLKYLAQQIVALKVHIGYIQKGYKIANQGLDFIGKATKGEFTLHGNYFTSLRQVNPEVRKFPQAQQAIDLFEAIAASQQHYRTKLEGAGTLKGDELQYVLKVYDRIGTDCNEAADELEKVLSNSRLEMTDDERIKRISYIHQRMQENYLISIGFSKEALQLALMRRDEKSEIEISRSINKSIIP